MALLHLQDEVRVKASVARVEPLDFAKESKVLLDCIAKMDRGEPVHPTPDPPGAGTPTSFLCRMLSVCTSVTGNILCWWLPCEYCKLPHARPTGRRPGT